MNTLTIHAQVVLPRNAKLELNALAGCELDVLDFDDLVATGSLTERGFCLIDVPLVAFARGLSVGVQLRLRSASGDEVVPSLRFPFTPEQESQPNARAEEWTQAVTAPAMISARIALTVDQAAHLKHLKENERDNQRAALRRRWLVARRYAVRIASGLFALDALIAFAAGKWPQPSYSPGRDLQMLVKLFASDALKGGFLHRVFNAVGLGGVVILTLLIAAGVVVLAQRLLGSAFDDMLKRIRELFKNDDESKSALGPLAGAAGITGLQAMTAVVVITGGVVAGTAALRPAEPPASASKPVGQSDDVDRKIAEIEVSLAGTSAALTSTSTAVAGVVNKVGQIDQRVGPLAELAAKTAATVDMLAPNVLALRSEVTNVNLHMLTDDDIKRAVAGIKPVTVLPPAAPVVLKSELVMPTIPVVFDAVPVINKLDEVKAAVAAVPNGVVDGFTEPLNDLRRKAGRLVELARTDTDLDARIANAAEDVATDSARSLALGPMAGRRKLWQTVGDLVVGPRERFTMRESVLDLLPPGVAGACRTPPRRYTGRDSFVSALRGCWGTLASDVELKMVAAGRISY